MNHELKKTHRYRCVSSHHDFGGRVYGNWAVDKNPDGLKLHSPTNEAAKEGSSAFGFGASIGLLGTSLLYCLLAAGVLLAGKIRHKPTGTIPLTIAIIAALGFTASYIVDGYFY